jgi:hypothetical protein
MLQTPLHHCYLVSSSDTASCLEQIKSKLDEIYSQRSENLSFDADTVDTLTIEMARSLRERGQQKSSGEAFCVLRGFDTITIEAQNALLKIIESPAEGIHFFLVTPQPGQLLETIQSRVLRVDDVCGSVHPEEVQELVDTFIAADSLKKRLDILQSIETKPVLRQFVQLISQTKLPRENARFGEALESVADWGRDTGASVKLLGQYLATAADSSPKKQ